jgi:hypothetical protein
MKISTESIQHYTLKFKNIFLIIQNGFKYSSFTEELPFSHFQESFFSMYDGLGVIKFQQKVSAVCFCDLPLNLIENHRQQYGKYCIALSKGWAIQNGVTPIRYIHSGSPDIHNDTYRSLTQNHDLLKECDFNIFKFFSKNLRETDQVQNLKDEDLEKLPGDQKKLLSLVNQQYLEVIDHSLKSMGYLRNYKGKWKDKKTGEIKEKNFYDEREWRALKLTEAEYLKFEFKDITHIFVETKNEKEFLINQLNENLNIENKEALSKISVFDEVSEELKNSL